MKLKNKKVEDNSINNMERKWKDENKQYLDELQRFFDSVDNIKDIELRRRVTSQMLICDKVLTEIAEEMFDYYYQKGYQKAKQG